MVSSVLRVDECGYQWQYTGKSCHCWLWGVRKSCVVTCTLRQILQASEDEKKAEAPAARRWCIAVDGSHAAHNAFLTCLRLASPKDFIQVIYASDDARKGTSSRAS